MRSVQSNGRKVPSSPRIVADAKSSINLRIGEQTRQLIDSAAVLVGKTRTEFMIDSARQKAIDVVLDQRLFTLPGDQYQAFATALNTPALPGPKLRALMRRTPAWDRMSDRDM